MPRLLRATRDESLVAELLDPRPLTYSVARRDDDVPVHVRAGSAIRRHGDRLIVVQDDVHALALLHEPTGAIEPILLPEGSDGRRTFGDALGNKALKMDLEACVTLPDGRFVAFGSGSTDRREHIVVLDDRVRVVDGHALYESLRADADFAGSELNVEGATIVADEIWLFQRGNGAPRNGLGPVDAIGRLSVAALAAFLDGGPVPTLQDVVGVELGSIAGVRLGFTDAVTLPGGRVAFVAGAEDSPDTFRDGEVVGCAFGIIEGATIRTTVIRDVDGAPTRLKLEGIDFVAMDAEGTLELVVVADMDDPDSAALMARLVVRER